MNTEYRIQKAEVKYSLLLLLQHSKFSIRHSIFLKSQVEYRFTIG
jgi:hypothetical protein